MTLELWVLRRCDLTVDVAENKAACQSIEEAETVRARVSFEITYRDPSNGELHQLAVNKSVSAGREPSDDGLVLSAGLRDSTISGDAVRISERVDASELVVENTSRYASIEVQRDIGSSSLARTDKLIVSDSEFTVVVPGSLLPYS